MRGHGCEGASLSRLFACMYECVINFSILLTCWCIFLWAEQLGAQRFVNYWKSRREVFGPDKSVLRMSLSDALCDDLAAVEACVFRPLPHLDASGR